MSRLCSLCRKPHLDRPLVDVPVYSRRERYRHHTSLLDLKNSARDGCKLCDFFVRYMPVSIIKAWNPGQFNGLYTTYYRLEADDPDHGTLEFQLGGSSHNAATFRIYELAEDFNENRSCGVVEEIEGWVKDCAEGHALCQPETPAFTPTRLVDLDPGPNCSNDLRIINTKSRQSRADRDHLLDYPYVALSYCWGKSMPEAMKTTSLNIRSREAGFSSSSLPKTLLDAVRITRECRIRYLWIDALCILQDSKADWEEESGRMASVYSYAYFTLAASSASDVDTGFPTYPCTTFPRENQILIYGAEDTKRKFLIDLKRDVYSQKLDVFPLQKRGWTLQERHLSTRVVHFLDSYRSEKEHLRWECRELVTDNKLPRSTRPKIHVVSEIPSLSEQLHGFWHDGNAKIKNDWPLLVEEYSRRNLTFESDKLVAIAGLAAVFNAEAVDKYLAGLWLRGVNGGRGDDFIQQLCWSREASSPGHLEKRSSNYCAPSWSWASTGPVAFRQYEIPRERRRGRIYEAVVREASTTLVTSNPYGSVSAGLLVIGGALKRARFKSASIATAGHQTQPIYQLDQETRIETEMKLDVLFDSHSTSSDGWTDVFCFRLKLYEFGRFDDEKKVIPEDPRDLKDHQTNWETDWKEDLNESEGKRDRADALVLIPDKNDPRNYQRIGFITMYEIHFKDCPWEIIRIV